MAAYINRKDTKLKWHRFNQILLMPLSIVLDGYLLYEVFITILNLNSSLNGIFQQASISISSIFIIVLILGLLGFLLLDLFAWIGSFTWKKSSYHCWMVHLLLKFICVLYFFYLVFSTSFIDMIVFDAAVYAVSLNRAVLEVLFGLILALLVFYYVLNLAYYFKRRKLYGPKKESIPSTKEERANPIVDTMEPKIELSLPENKNTEGPAVQSREEAQPVVDDKAVVKEEGKLIYCPHCGAKIEREDAVFCNQCGKKLYE